MKDTEAVLDALEKVLKANLNDEIALINTNKNDGITLDTVDDNAIYLEELNSTTINYNPFLVYGVGSDTMTQVGTQVSSALSLYSVIVIASSNVDNIMKRLLRYNEAMRQTFQNNWDYMRVELTSTGPLTFESANNAEYYKGIGIEINLSQAY